MWDRDTFVTISPMISTRIRRYRSEDLDSFTRLFNEVNGFLGSERAYDTELMAERLSPPLCQPEDDCYLAESDGSLVGFALLCPELPIGRTVAISGVLDSHRDSVGTKLLKAMVERAISLEAGVLHTQVPADDEDAGRTLHAEGFTAIRYYWQMWWEGSEVPSLKLPDGYALRSFRTGEDEVALTRLQNAAFSQSWGFSPNTVEEISARVHSKRSDPDGIIFLINNDQPAAYNWTLRASNAESSTGWISMTGAHPDHRGKGLGTAAVVAGMEFLKAKGVGGIELEVDRDNAPAREMYLKLGFKTVATTVWYEKVLELEATPDC